MTCCNIYCKLKIGNWNFFYLAIFALDRITKWYAYNLPPGKVISILPGIDFGYFLNPSLFFFPAWRFIPWLALAVLIILILVLLINSKPQAPNYKEITSPKSQIPTGLKFRILNLFGIWDLGFGNSLCWPLISIILGGASNVFDRFAYGGVIDYVNILGIATINLADILILLGLILLIRNSYDQRS